MGLRVLEYNYDVTNRKLIGDPNTPGSFASTPEITFKEKVIFQLTCYKLVDEAYVAYTNFAADDSFTAVLDTDYNRLTLPLVRVSAGAFNQTADWADADPTAGKLCFQLNSNTLQLMQALGSTPTLETAGLEILVRPSGQTAIAGVLGFNIRVRNIRDNADMTSSAGWTRTGNTTLTNASDYSGLILPGAMVQVTIGGTDYLGTTVSAVYTSLTTLTLSGVTLPAGTVTSLYYETLPDAVPSSHYTNAEIEALLAAKVSTSSLTTAINGASPSNTKVPTEKAVTDFIRDNVDLGSVWAFS